MLHIHWFLSLILKYKLYNFLHNIFNNCKYSYIFFYNELVKIFIITLQVTNFKLDFMLTKVNFWSVYYLTSLKRVQFYIGTNFRLK